MKKILAAAILALALAISHTACAADEEVAPTQPPTFHPTTPTGPNPGSDLDILKKLMGDLDDDDDKPVKLDCQKKHPCVLGYRFSARVDGDSVGKFQKFMEAALAAGADTVMIEINTPGGMMTAGHEMSRAIENANLTVACVVDGSAASTGMYILQSCDVRVMTKRSVLMVHKTAVILPGGARLDAEETERLQSSMAASTRGYIEWVTHRMKVSVKDVMAKVAHGEWYMNWDEALKVGAVDRVISDPPEAYFQQLKAGKP